jgi:predicted enzyme related to lactoylglutathione lyase
VAKATSLGAKVVVPVQPIPGIGRFAVLQDPQGAYFSLHESQR